MLTPKQVAKRMSADEKKKRMHEVKHKKQIEERIDILLEIAVNNGQITNLGGIISASYLESDRIIEIEYLQKFGWEPQYQTKDTYGYSMTTESESCSTEHYYSLKPKQ